MDGIVDDNGDWKIIDGFLTEIGQLRQCATAGRRNIVHHCESGFWAPISQLAKGRTGARKWQGMIMYSGMAR